MGTTPLVQLHDGRARGTWSDGVARFRGIPYATAARFAPPVPVTTPTDLDATDFGPIAPQVGGAQFQRADLVQDEQCLSLNVWTPGADGAGRPIMVWIHGGAFRSGSGASPLYEGTTLAARGDVVIVTINYRLGLLGYLGHPDLIVDGTECANWGILDCVEALRWVRAHGAAFGGDPDDVTIFGESAGASAVSLLCAMPAARGLFHKAVVQSGAPLTSTMARAVEVAERAVALAGVGDVTDLRDLPVGQILAVQQQMETETTEPMWIPAVDGSSIPTLPGRAIGEGSAAGIPLLLGSNVDEWRLYAAADPHSRDLDEDRLRSRLERSFPTAALDGLIDAVRDARSARGEGAAPNDLFYAIETERVFRVPALRIADSQAAHAPTFVYLFGWGSPAMGGWLGACHGLEIAFVFGNQGRGELAAFTGSGPKADALAERMMDAWLAFGRTGDPSTPELPWPPHDPATRPTMVFDVTSGLRHAPRDEERAAIDALASRSA